MSAFGFQLLFSETLTGAGALGLPNYTYRESNAGFSATLGGTGCTFSLPAASTAGGYADWASARVVTVGEAAMEGLMLFTAQTTNEQFMGLWLRGDGLNTQSKIQDDNSYWLETYQTGNQLRLWKMQAGVGTPIGTSAKVWTAEDWYLRFAVVGSALYARAWAASGAEPGTWDIQIADASIASGTRCGFGLNGGNSGAVTFSQLVKSVSFWVSSGRRGVYRRF